MTKFSTSTVKPVVTSADARDFYQYESIAQIVIGGIMLILVIAASVIYQSFYYFSAMCLPAGLTSVTAGVLGILISRGNENPIVKKSAMAFSIITTIICFGSSVYAIVISRFYLFESIKWIASVLFVVSCYSAVSQPASNIQNGKPCTCKAVTSPVGKA